MQRLELDNPDNPNEKFVTEIRNNEEVKFRELKTVASFTEMTGLDEETEIITTTFKRKFLTSISN
jgi:hypothetical protein